MPEFRRPVALRRIAIGIAINTAGRQTAAGCYAQDKSMSPLSAVIILTALGPPDWLPPAPEVTFTQVDQHGKELSESYAAVCAMGKCRGALPVGFWSGSCLVSGWVKMPEGAHLPGEIRFSAGLCTASAGLRSGENGGLDGFWLDAHGAASTVVQVDRDGGPMRDLVGRPDNIAFIRVDIIASTHAHP